MHFKDEYAKKLLLPFTFTYSKSMPWKISHYLSLPFLTSMKVTVSSKQDAPSNQICLIYINFSLRQIL